MHSPLLGLCWTNNRQNGLLRLVLPKSRDWITIWDTPTPPLIINVPRVCYIPLVHYRSSRFHTIDLKGTTGLTFFIHRHELQGIHAHTPAMPDARPTAQSLQCDLDHEDMIWVYLPLSANGKLMEFANLLEIESEDGPPIDRDPCFLVSSLVVRGNPNF